MFKWTFLERENIVGSRTGLHLSLPGLDAEIIAIKDWRSPCKRLGPWTIFPPFEPHAARPWHCGTCTSQLRLSKSSSCWIETVFPAFVLLFMPCIFFPTKAEGKRLEWDKYSYKRQPDSLPKSCFQPCFCYLVVSKTFLVDLLSAGKSAKFP